MNAGNGDTCADEKGMILIIEVKRKEDGRWIAEVPSVPGVVAYGGSRESALARVKALALRVLAERIEQGEGTADLDPLSSREAA